MLVMQIIMQLMAELLGSEIHLGDDAHALDTDDELDESW
jgi:histidinol phosphatase-like PHP family hydrolase